MTGHFMVVRMRSSKYLQYVFVDDNFYRLDEPLIRKDMSKEQQRDIQKKIAEMKNEIESIEIEVPGGVRAEFKLIPVGNGKGFVGRMEVMVYEQGFKGWNEFIQKEGAEKFMQRIIEDRRARTIERVKELRKEMEKDEEIDVQVLGKSGMHRVYGKGKSIECDCKLFGKLGECHHVALVKTKIRDGEKLEKNAVIEPPMLMFKKGLEEISYDKERNILNIPMRDKNKTLTIRTLHNYGYGLGAMKEMHIVPKKFKLEHLVEVVHGMDFEEEMNKINEELKAKEQGKEQEEEISEGMEMGA